MRAALCTTLARYRDQPLSMEVAQAIVLALCGTRAPIDPLQFRPVVHGPYVIQAEALASVLSALYPLHLAHYAETEKHRAGIPMDPDYAAMLARDDGGHCLQLTVRHAGELVGHLRMWVWPRSLHTSRPIAEEDALYIRPDHRGSFLVMAMLRTAERWLRQAVPGLSEIKTNSKLVARREGGPDASVLMRRLGFNAIGLMHSKVFAEEGESHVQ